MPQPDPVASYLDGLCEALSFDAALSLRVREEVAFHFQEAIAAGLAPHEAVVRFGPVRDIAAEYAATSLTGRAKSSALIFLLGVLTVYMAMRGRVAWWGPSDLPHLSVIAAMLVPFMRGAFWLALFSGLLYWAISSRISFAREPSGRLRAVLSRAIVFSAGAAVVSAACVAADAILVSIRIWETPWSSESMIPAVLLAAEILLSAFLVRHWRLLAIHVSAGSRLLTLQSEASSSGSRMLP